MSWQESRPEYLNCRYPSCSENSRRTAIVVLHGAPRGMMTNPYEGSRLDLTCQAKELRWLPPTKQEKLTKARWKPGSTAPSALKPLVKQRATNTAQAALAT